LEGIIEVVVKPIKIQLADVRLTAFLNVSETFSMTTKKLSDLLKEKLPPYMIPSAYKLMHGFPKTTNGKTEKNALTIDINDLVIRKRQDLNTLTQTEEKIFNIWSETLKSNNISITDNFFYIGGNSLIVISVISKIRDVFKIDLGVRVFFDSPRIIDIAETIDLIKQRATEMDSAIINKNKFKFIKGEI
jgi:acyl carrier protein